MQVKREYRLAEPQGFPKTLDVGGAERPHRRGAERAELAHRDPVDRARVEQGSEVTAK